MSASDRNSECDDVDDSTSCLARQSNNNLDQAFVYSPKNETIQEEDKVKQYEWSIVNLVNSSTKKSKPSTIKEDEEFKSELHIKTKQLNERLEWLDEVQTLNTQLQKSREMLECTEKKLTVSKNETERFKAELQQVDAKLSNEKKARESLEAKLTKMQMQMNKSVANISIMRSPSSANSIAGDESDEMFELREQITQLLTANYEKDDMILELTVQLKILQHELRVQSLHNKCLIRREDLASNIFPQPWLETIKDMELDIKKLRFLVSQKSNLENVNGEEMVEFIENATQKLGDITKDVEENRAAYETNLENVRIKRREFSESIAEIQTALQKAIEEYSEMETNLEN